MIAADPFDEGDAPPARYAVVYAPRRKRERVPEQCVELVDSAEQALAQADAAQSRYAASVVGPLRSSEGFRVFFVVQWL